MVLLLHIGYKFLRIIKEFKKFAMSPPFANSTPKRFGKQPVHIFVVCTLLY